MNNKYKTIHNEYIRYVTNENKIQYRNKKGLVFITFNNQDQEEDFFNEKLNGDFGEYIRDYVMTFISHYKYPARKLVKFLFENDYIDLETFKKEIDTCINEVPLDLWSNYMLGKAFNNNRFVLKECDLQAFLTPDGIYTAQMAKFISDFTIELFELLGFYKIKEFEKLRWNKKIQYENNKWYISHGIYLRNKHGDPFYITFKNDLESVKKIWNELQEFQGDIYSFHYRQVKNFKEEFKYYNPKLIVE